MMKIVSDDDRNSWRT